MRIRRGHHFCVRLTSSVSIDLNALLSGSIRKVRRQVPVAACPLVGGELRLSTRAFQFLRELSPGEWLELDEASAAPEDGDLSSLVANGLIITDRETSPDMELRCRDEAARESFWHPYAFLHHAITRGERPETEALPKDLDQLAEQARLDLANLVAKSPPPEPAFQPSATQASSTQEIALPIEPTDERLFELMAGRSTVRIFDRDSSITQRQLSILLREVWGVVGTSESIPGLKLFKKTSPSGGALHPTEVFPLIISVQGMEPGVYHYNAESHRLACLHSLDVEAARDLADRVSGGQIYPRNAAALFMMTSRFERCFWKYRNHAKAYRVACFDVGHLSQSFYLACTAIGLGPFFSAAIDDEEIETLLNIDGIGHAPMAICGCGVPTKAGINLGLRVEPSRI